MKLVCILLAPIVFLSCQDNSDKEHVSTEPAKRTDSSIINPPTPNPYAIIDISPMDMSYYPVDYPKRTNMENPGGSVPTKLRR